MSQPTNPNDAEVIDILNKHAQIMSVVYERINKVHKRPLHEGQIKIAKDYFVNGKELILAQMGRNLGKTECALYIATVAALLNPGFIIMIITPELKQGKKIYWTSGRLPNYAPPEFIQAKGTSELKVEFTNGSVITVDGCENYDSLRGVKPNLVIYDEFQDHSKEFHLEVMQPNLLGKNSALIVFGTPPKKRSAYFVEFREQLMKRLESKDSEDRDTASYYELPSEMNPSIDKKKLRQIRKQLYDSGNEVIWLREYEGKMAFGGEDVVFPKWNPPTHVKKHAVVMSFLENDKHKLKWFTICDPGTSTCFAVLFICYNPYTQQVFFLDEIYEKDRKRTDSRQMWERIRNKEKELYPESQLNTWKRYYDEAAAWFYNEIAAMHRGQMLSLAPTRKQHSNEETDISRIKMCMAQEGAMTVSDRCYWLRWEIESFITKFDKNGDPQYVDTNNHLLDCMKYFMQVSGWTLMEKAEEIRMNAESVYQPILETVDNWADAAVENSLYPENYGHHSRTFEWFN